MLLMIIHVFCDQFRQSTDESLKFNSIKDQYVEWGRLWLDRLIKNRDLKSDNFFYCYYSFVSIFNFFVTEYALFYFILVYIIRFHPKLAFCNVTITSDWLVYWKKSLRVINVFIEVKQRRVWSLASCATAWD